MEIKPLRDYIVLVETSRVEEIENVSGIIIPEGADIVDVGSRGRVSELGPEVKDLEIGQKVLFKRHQCEEVEIEKHTFLIGKSECVYAILK